MSTASKITVAYEPNEKQIQFHGCGATEVVYGGAKGGGKTCALVMEALAYAMEYPNSTIYMFRESYDDLEANIISEWTRRVPQELYKYHQTKHLVTMYNGSKVFFRYVRDKRDAEQYDGRSIDMICIDELTKHEEPIVQQLLSCLRSPQGFPPRFRASCNPGGIGHIWVKNRYIRPTNKGEKIYKDEVSHNTVAFIPATVYDNYAIMQNDPAYVRRLENLPPKKKQAFLHGDWDQFDGQAFEEWDPDVHIVEPFDIPDYCYRWMSVDNGYTDPFAWYWFFVDENGFVYIYREFTRKTNQPKLTYTEQAIQVQELSTRLEVEHGKLIKTTEPIGMIYAGHDAFATHPLAAGKTIAHYYNQAGLKRVVSSIPDRRLRKATFHEYLKPFEHEGKMVAKLRIFSNCEQLIETLPRLSEDEKDAEKVEDCSLDHWYDASGYGIVSYHVNQSSLPVTIKKDTLPWPLRVEEKLAEQGVEGYVGW